MKGWVYVISNNAMPGLSKVGYSMKDPALRAAELNHTGSPHPYLVDYEVLVNNPREIEQAVHRRLSDRREGKEWFRCSAEEAIAEITAVVGAAALNENFTRADRVKAETIARKNAEAARARQQAEEALRRQEAILNEKREEISSRYDTMLKAALPDEKFWEPFFGFAILLAIILSVVSLNIPGIGIAILSAIGSYFIISATKKKAKNSPRYRSIIAARDAEFAIVDRKFDELYAPKNPAGTDVPPPAAKSTTRTTRNPAETSVPASTAKGYTRTTRFDGTCKKCGAKFTVTLTGYDSGARCPECFHLNYAPQRVGQNFKMQLRDEALELKPEVHLMNSERRNSDTTTAPTASNEKRSIKPVFIDFICPYCNSRKKMEDSHLISCPSCGRSSFTR